MANSKMKKNILVVFFGRRGGGQAVLDDLVLSLGDLTDKINIVVWKSQKNLANVSSRLDLDCEIKNFSIIHNGRSLFKPLQLLSSFFSIIQLRQELKKLRPVFIVQVMPSPFDYFVDYFAVKMSIPIVRLIHDFRAHPGECWPTERAIRTRVDNAQIIIVFSNYVLSNLESYFQNEIAFKQCKLAQLPKTIRDDKESEIRFFNYSFEKSKIRMAFVGRGLRYKGLDFLAGALAEVKFNFEFIAGGSGEFPKSLISNYKVINRWLSESEFMNIVQQSDLIILPYVEASQSGIIPLAKKAGKWILATNVGGLKEQLDGYKRSVVVEPESRDALVEGLERIYGLWLLNGEFSRSTEDHSTKPGIGKVIGELLDAGE
jgi:glycosyltransferase involved in cell wall biosynthesis